VQEKKQKNGSAQKGKFSIREIQNLFFVQFKNRYDIIVLRMPQAGQAAGQSRRLSGGNAADPVRGRQGRGKSGNNEQRGKKIC